MPFKPMPAGDLDSILADAKRTLATMNDGSEPWRGGVAPVRRRKPGDPVTLKDLVTGDTDAPPEAPITPWEGVKKVAHYSPLDPTNGDKIATSLDDPMARKSNDANTGIDFDVAGFGGRIPTSAASLKSFLAGSVKGLNDYGREQATPLGLASLPLEAEGVAARTAMRAGAGIFGAEGAETALDSTQSTGRRALGAAQGLMGLLGVVGPHGSSSRPRVNTENPTVRPGQFSEPYSEAHRFNGDPVSAPPPTGPRRMPTDLFDTPEFRGPEPPPPPPPAPPAYDGRRPARVDAQTFEGGGESPTIPTKPENPLLKVLSTRQPYPVVEDASLPDDAIFQRTMGGEGLPPADPLRDLLTPPAARPRTAPEGARLVTNPSAERPATIPPQIDPVEAIGDGLSELGGSHGAPGSWNGRPQNVGFAGDAQAAAKFSRARGMREWAAKQAEQPVAPVPSVEPVPSELPIEAPEPTGPPKPRVTAQEFADLLAGRQKFSEANPGVEPAPGMRDELDRAGLEYKRTQSELKRLLGMPDADPAEVARMQQGARELGSRLRGTALEAAAPPLPPLPEGFAELNAELGDLNAPPPAAPGLVTPPGREGHFSLPKPSYMLPEDQQLKFLADTPARADARYDEVNNRRASDTGNAAGDRRGADPETLARIQAEMDATAAAPPTGGGEPIQPSDLSDSFQREFGINNGRGEMSPELMSLLARPVIGGAIGGIFGDPDHRLRDTAIGAGLGAASKVVNPERLRYASMLTGLAQAKNLAGDVGVVGHTAAERALTHGPSEGFKVLREFFSPETARDYMTMLRGEKEAPLNRLDRPESVSSEGLTGLPFRFMGAADGATQNSLRRAGVTDAGERTFTGDPKSDVGGAGLGFQRKGGVWARAIAPFLKTGINQAEAATLPFGDLGNANPATAKQALAKVLLLGAGAGAGAAYGSTEFSDDHPKTTALLTALMAPAALPAVMGAGAAAGFRKDKNPYEILKLVLKAGVNQLPLPSQWLDDPGLQIKSFAPPALDLINPDDVKHDTSHGIFDALLSRIPGLSQMLPASGGSGKSRRARHTRE